MEKLSCGSDLKLLIANFRPKLKKVGKTIMAFRYVTVEVTNRFKGLDLTECLKNYAWRFVTV